MPDGGEDQNKDVQKNPKGQRTIVVEEEKCIGCGICVYLCPHDALTLQDGIPVVTGKCKVCGLCAASCITKAISMRAKKFTDEGLLDVDVKDVVVFSCRRNVDKEKSYDATVISLLCASRLDPYLIAEVLDRGAKGVVIATCGKNCRNYPGSEEAKNKAELVKKILEKVGEDPNRVRIVEGAFEDVIRDMKDLSEVKSADVVKAATLNRDLRAIIARMRGIVEEGNVYGEKIGYDEYSKILDEAVERAVRFAVVLKNLNGGAKISEIVEKTGLKYSEVLEAILEMKRKGMIEIGVEDELYLKA